MLQQVLAVRTDRGLQETIHVVGLPRARLTGDDHVHAVGAGKSTTAVHLALGLAARGERVLLVDADTQAATVLDWSSSAGDDWPDNVVVVPWATPGLAKRVTAIAAD